MSRVQVTRVVVSLDTHHLAHIANPEFWRKCDDNSHPAPFTIISAADIKNNVWEAAQPSMKEWALSYAEQLEQQGRFQICIWPEHCIIGTEGQNVHPLLTEALNRWMRKHSRVVEYLLKGQNNQTEMYSALKAEVAIEDDPTTPLNTELIGLLAQHKQVVVCGQAKSHCVNYTTRDLVAGWPADREASDIVLLDDGTSAVPGFEEAANAFENDMKAAGVTVVHAADYN
eukprot:TRINITY_DN5123_c0_g1_i2.p1 TRINITY_DN5123_c0_g1~~TRINITY_DN5123_c0_g1_i2.p1  ORF type:complete len:228 (-),score=60.81 TRINITY_DN5123_c0_g1_i2:195-878(-)